MEEAQMEAGQRDDVVSTSFRNDVLQAEGNLNALWHCIRAYKQSTTAWWDATAAVLNEYKRVTEMSLFCATAKTKKTEVMREMKPLNSSDNNHEQDREQEDNSETHAARLVRALVQVLASVQPEFEQMCDAVLKPLSTLCHDMLPEVKHTYWTRHSSWSHGGLAKETQIRRLEQERETLSTKLREDVETSMKAFVELQKKMLAAIQGLEKEQHVSRHQSQLQPECAARKRDLGRGSSGDIGSLQASSTEVHGIGESGAVLSSGSLYEEIMQVQVSIDAAARADDLLATGEHSVASSVEVDDAGMSVDASKRRESMEGEGCNDSDDVELAGGEAEVEKADKSIVDQDVEEPSSHMWVWGRPPSLESGTPVVLRPKKVSLLNGQSILQVACGGEHLLYLTSTGDVYSYGDNEDKKAAAVTMAIKDNPNDSEPARSSVTVSFLAPRLVEELALEKALHRTTIATIACGAQHSLAITDAGELYTWGSGEDGRLGHGDMRDRAVPRKVMSLLRESVVNASCGGAHTAVLTTKGTVFTFGRGRNGRLGLGDYRWRDTPHPIQEFPKGTRIAHVVCGWNFTAALDCEGKLFTWGKTGEGQCGLGYVDKDQVVPRCVEKLREVAGGSAVVDVACGYTHTVVMTAVGELFSWGLGEYGQLGTGDVYQPLPARVQLPEDVLCSSDQLARVHCGAFHSIATTENHVMYAWGLNSYGACGLGHTANKDRPERIDCFSTETELIVACGHKYTIALEVHHDLNGHDSSSFRASAQAGAAVATSAYRLNVPRTQRQISEGSEAGEDILHRGRVLSDIPNSLNSATRHRRGSSFNTAMELDDVPREAIHVKEEELRRAKKLWRTRILRDWEENKDTPLAHSLWRQGIPPSIRARVWPMAIGNKLKVTPEMFKIYRRRAIAYKKDRVAKEENGTVDGGREHTLALIDTDLPRTFPSLKLFDSSGPYYAFLLEVLETYACYRPDLGYIQGMSYLAAMLCLHMPQDRYLAFQCLANLMVNEHLFTFYLLDADLANVYYTLFDAFLNSRHPHLHAHLREIGIMSCSMYLMNWLQTLFLQVLPLESATRVFDNFLLDGTVFLFRTAMAIHELLGPRLIVADIDVALPLLQRNVIYQEEWSMLVSEQALFDTVATIAVPSHIYSALDRVVNDVFFYEKRGELDSAGGKKMMAFASGGQSVGIGHVKHERRRMYAISDALNGVLGGF
uniref:Rab-GAP TBC domain-containing protein n=1 Tax=Hyaloperonospora arabidopsidis (strain Emoy2) TaxID=559515 RepID=M4C3K0_HYAAE